MKPIILMAVITAVLPGAASGGFTESRKVEDPTFGGRVTALECITEYMALIGGDEIGPLSHIPPYQRINAFLLWPGRGLLSMNGGESRSVSISGFEESPAPGHRNLEVHWGNSFIKIEFFLDSFGVILDGASSLSSHGAKSIFFGTCTDYSQK